MGIQTFGTIIDLWDPGGTTKDRPIGLQRDPNNQNRPYIRRRCGARRRNGCDPHRSSETAEEHTMRSIPTTAARRSPTSVLAVSALVP